jgi:hypothetical protein
VRPLWLGWAALAVVFVATAWFLFLRGDGEEAAEPAASGGLERCAALADDEARACYREELAAVVAAAETPQDGSARADAIAREQGGFLLSNCHGIMHTVGREYARAEGVTLENLMDNLPQSNDPGCSAGFAHGLVTGVAPQIDVSAPEGAVAVCDDTETRYQRYSCVHGFGHAFMRISGEELDPALDLCRGALGDEAPDCAQGAFHDYWFAVAGLDDTERPAEVTDDPRRLCGEQEPEFVRPCWYRAFVDARPPGGITVAADLQRLCPALEGLQRDGCITAASVIGPPDPRAQLALCAGLRDADATSCIHGVKAQNFLGQSLEADVALIQRCALFPEPAARNECYRWLGKTLNVVTDGEFGERGCRAVTEADARIACEEGAAALDEPLVTFS